MNLPGNIRNVYFLGIGGIGMSALAQWFKARGCHVSGYDRTPSLITRKLQENGIDVHFKDDPKQIPESPDLVVYTPAIPGDLKEYAHVLSTGVHLMKRAEVLGAISRDLFTIAIGGTHGKTSISSLCAWILHEAGEKATAFIGGISKNFGSNLVLTEPAKYLIAEADEYDRSFLNLHPDIALISAIDSDHLDIYGTREEMLDAYRAFANLGGTQGTLIRSVNVPEIQVRGRSYTYGLQPSADFFADDIQVEGFGMSFTLHHGSQAYPGFHLKVPGRHNVENALAAIAVCYCLGLDLDTIRKAISSYSGVERRFDFRCDNGTTIYLDDYAHHPEEIKACIKALREIYPHKHITGIFQPHLYSRTRDFAEGFAQSLDTLDEVILMDIYPARELPLADVDSGMILRRMQNPNKQILTRAEILEHITSRKPEVLVTLGAGDIDRLVMDIEKLLKTKMNCD